MLDINYSCLWWTGNDESSKQAANKTNKKLKILGVTVLTSFSESAIKQTGHTKKINNIVIQQAKLAKQAGLDGIICSGHEARLIKKFAKVWKLLLQV